MAEITCDSVISVYQHQLESCGDENIALNSSAVSVEDVCLALDNQDLISNLFDKKSVENLLAQQR